ncbi:hypothetical protein G3I39_25175 [Streptomyces fulvissimus]|uniref:Uncharacterized protein n=1 Tax=Streptomyces microflavus TaxID=1919 RepID=A0A6N9VFR8_STRMI|nr:hypothetical protein [Streptomyces microflavus]NEB70322.1 hypothetical protein [Streptomyces microflavus]NEE48838.1 hypothetical protein [Streptomyces sp. SID8455]
MEPSKQVSYESALEVYRSRAAELFHKNSMLEARILDLEARLQQEAPAHEPEPEPNFGAG